MRFPSGFRILASALAALILAASPAAAQTAEIAGVVRDSSGGVLPGVTVEASSPALIEKSRSVVTDSQGQYRIIDLRPGTYLVTMSLEGFNAFRREGVILVGTGTTTVADIEAVPELLPEVWQATPLRVFSFLELTGVKSRRDPKAILDEVSRTLKNAPEVRQVLIMGHTCNIGSDRYNQDLSGRRAASVKDYLIESGVEAGRLRSKGYGESRPLAPNSTEDGRVLNRRVELKVLDHDPCVPPATGDSVNEQGCTN